MIFVRTVQEAPELPAASEAMDQKELVLVQETIDQDVENGTRDRKENLHTVYSANRSKLLGRDPRAVRAELRSKLEPGYYLSETGRSNTLILHRLGACFAIPGLDYLKFLCVGPAMHPEASLSPDLQTVRWRWDSL